MKFVISPSQQIGNRCICGDTEQDHMYQIGEEVYNRLKSDSRFEPYLIPKLTGSDKDNLYKATALSNQFIGNDKGYHLALHSDGGYAGHGASGFYAGEPSKTWGKPIFDEICNLTPWEDMTCSSRPSLYELRRTTASAFLLEVSFHDKKDEADWIHNNVDKIADAIVEGIYKGLGIPRISININGKTIPAITYNGSTYGPIRAIGEALGKTVEWDQETKTAYIK